MQPKQRHSSLNGELVRDVGDEESVVMLALGEVGELAGGVEVVAAVAAVVRRKGTALGSKGKGQEKRRRASQIADAPCL